MRLPLGVLGFRGGPTPAREMTRLPPGAPGSGRARLGGTPDFSEARRCRREVGVGVGDDPIRLSSPALGMMAASAGGGGRFRHFAWRGVGCFGPSGKVRAVQIHYIYLFVHLLLTQAIFLISLSLSLSPRVFHSGTHFFSQFSSVCLGPVDSWDVPSRCFSDPLSSPSRVNEAGQLPSKEQETLPRFFRLDSDRPYQRLLSSKRDKIF